jgi:hypothetical protein
MARGRTAPAAQEAPNQEPQSQEAQPTEAAVDLTAFNTAVEAAVGQKDQSTGTLPTAAVESVKAEYRKLDGAKAKREAKQALADGMKAGMEAMDIQTVRAYDQLLREAAVAGGTSKEKPPADPTEAFVNLVVTLDLARTIEAPEGVAEDWESRKQELYAKLVPQLEQYRTWLAADESTRGDEPEVSDLVKQAVRLQQGRKSKGRSGTGAAFTGTRGNTAAHIQEAFSDKESGTFLTIAEIVAFTSKEYGDRHPSPGAIQARLFPKSGKVPEELNGVTPGTNEHGVRGATKA